MFAGAKKSAEAKASVLGPHGPWFERPPVPPSVPVDQPLILLVPALQAQVATYFVCAVIATVIAAIEPDQQRLFDTVFGTMVGIGFVVWMVFRSLTVLSKPKPAPNDATFRSVRSSRSFGHDRAAMIAVIAVAELIPLGGKHQTLAPFTAMVALLYSLGLTWQLWRATQLERRSHRLGVLGSRKYDVLSGKSVIYVDQHAN